nr:IS3 family transposase [Rickettsia endosymbiont of Ceutorhynchus assimilis]
MKRLASKRALDNQQLTEKIKEIFTANYQTYGSPRIHAELREQGFVCSRPRVARLMSVTGIQAKMYKKFKKTTKQSNKPYHRGEDLVKQNFSVSSPNNIWVADISYIYTFYNQKRRHSTLNYKTPNEYELNYKKIKNASL